MRAALLTILLCTSALAQPAKPLLDLGSAPQAPEAGKGAAANALAEDLRPQVDEITTAAGATERDKARAAARSFIRQLATTGEAAGQRGSQRLLIARTLLRALDQIDRLIPSDDSPGAAIASKLLRDDLELGAAALGQPDSDPWRVTRDSFASLTQLSAPGSARSGWPDDPPLDAALIMPFGADLDTWAALPGVSGETAAALRDLDTLTATAESWAAYAPASRHLRAAVRSAAEAMQSPISYLPDAAKRIMGEQFSAAVLKLDKDDRREAGLAELRRLGRLGRVAARAGAIEDQAIARKVRLSLIQMMGSTQPDLGSETRQLDAFERGMDLMAEKSKLADERDLARQLRPLNRALVPTLRDAERKLVAALPELITRYDAMTDPGTLAMISACKAALGDLQIVAELNTAMAGDKTTTSGEPVIGDRWKRIADRVLKLGQDVARPELRESALESIRGMGEQIAMFTKLPGEDSLRAAAQHAKSATPGAASPWTSLTGGREAALLSEISDRRGGWLDGWDKAGYAGSAGDVQRLLALRDLMEVLWDAGAVVSTGPDSLAALNAWSGWELTGDGLKALAPDLAGKTSEATRLITEGEATKCAEQVAKIKQDCAAALLAARLARRAAQGVAASFPVNDPLVEAGCGGPVAGASWMARWADELADVCRYADEVAVARKLGASSRGDALVKFINTRASAVNDELK